jgi:hypothetical protein
MSYGYTLLKKEEADAKREETIDQATKNEWTNRSVEKYSMSPLFGRTKHGDYRKFHNQ